MVSRASSENESARMVAFALQWLPYGGGSAEDIMVEFGMAPREYFTRLGDIVADQQSALEFDTRTALCKVCRDRVRVDVEPFSGV